jgi:hypothetical protein
VHESLGWEILHGDPCVLVRDPARCDVKMVETPPPDLGVLALESLDVFAAVG